MAIFIGLDHLDQFLTGESKVGSRHRFGSNQVQSTVRYGFKTVHVGLPWGHISLFSNCGGGWGG